MFSCRNAIALFAVTIAAASHSQSLLHDPAPMPAQPRLLHFADTAAAPCNRLPLSASARIDARRDRGELAVTVLSNFGCQTKAGDPAVRRDGESLVLFARTLLPGYPTPHCLCTRELRYVVEDPDAARIRYHQDQQPVVEAEIR